MKYRKKPVEVEAIQFNGSSTHAVDLKEWMETGKEPSREVHTRDIKTLEVKTLEGVLFANQGDWIIRGINGEFYPCRDDIFRKTYEPV